MAIKHVRGFRIRLKLVKLIKWPSCTDKAMTTRVFKSNPPSEMEDYRRADNELQIKLFYLSSPSSMGSSLRLYEPCVLTTELEPSFGSFMHFFFANPPNSRKKSVPKGHLAVYIGEEEGNVCRVLVPVIYFNHPLFGELLREAEKVYGHDHCGGIHVPCRLSEFEDVQSRICAAGGSWRSWL
ncbi:uncharacterized protein LOC143634255 [Bidens hawaiensis]|uniref:uncharacterized protein LOC143634255 n=1 Tax=Bidens hawaiensis TaxID=980011 RepID=UPI00404B4274